MSVEVIEHQRVGFTERTATLNTPLDQLLTDHDDIFGWTHGQRQEFLVPALRAAVTAHMQSCEPYARLCRSRGFAADQLQEPGDLARIPLVPSSAFKHQALVSGPPENIVKNCQSSGTQGTVSVVPRDNLTMQRFLGSAVHIADLLIGLPDRGMVFNLGPNSEEAGDLWFAYVMSILELQYPARHYVSGDVFAVSLLLDDLASLEEGVVPILVGPPALFATVAAEAEQAGVTLRLAEAGAFAITAGGWKRHGGEALEPAALAARVSAALGLSGPDRVRDAFNMVELNTVLFECEQHRKHLPAWLHVTARDPGTLDVLPAGEVGVLAWLDPTAASYPAFLMSDDFGLIDDSACPCGRPGESVSVVRRVRTVESRGCALKVDRTVQSAQPGSGTGSAS
jgi:long-chain-fatty-acid---luciferin-component ligase